MAFPVVFPIHVATDDNFKIPDDKVCYIIDGNGIFMKKKSTLMDSLVKVPKISALPKVIKEYASIDIPKLPLSIILEIIGFLKVTYNLHKSEGGLILFYNRETEIFQVGYPKQSVSSAGVDYKNGELFCPDGCLRIGTVHSHANFSAFHSGTDKNDEKDFPGIHFTIGHIDNVDTFSMVCSVVDSDRRFPIDIMEVIEGVELSKVPVKAPISSFVPKNVQAFLKRLEGVDSCEKSVLSYLKNKIFPKAPAYIQPYNYVSKPASVYATKVASAYKKLEDKYYKVSAPIPLDKFTKDFMKAVVTKAPPTYYNRAYQGNYYDSNNPGSIHFQKTGGQAQKLIPFYDIDDDEPIGVSLGGDIVSKDMSDIGLGPDLDSDVIDLVGIMTDDTGPSMRQPDTRNVCERCIWSSEKEEWLTYTEEKKRDLGILDDEVMCSTCINQQIRIDPDKFNSDLLELDNFIEIGGNK